ncbi:septum formation family protein [Georgenia sp. TF02-10]|uniref:septum formation family protein n=1 Tax=Georgenia sp. TF02-10 TaxID=2917725 RepID=UPI001FA7D8B3|nr:septum formation family protein [Georgenia sp. TF02-10]UNX54604.1 septum formation family protein [Georgenia sp. TF02-10]
MTTPWPGQVTSGRPFGQSFGSGQPLNTPPAPPPTTTAGRGLGLLAVPVAVPLGPLGFVLGLISYTQARRGRGPTRYGIIAMVVGALSTLLLALVLLLAVAGGVFTMVAQPSEGRGSEVPVGAMAVGDCAQQVGGDSPVVHLVDCAQPHQGEAYAEVQLGSGSYPGADPLAQQAGEACQATAEEMLPAGVDTTDLSVAPIVPDRRSWEEGATFARCLLLDVTGPNLTGSLVDGTLEVH